MNIYEETAPEGLFLKFQHGTVARVRVFGDAISFTKTFVRDGKAQEPRKRFATLVIYRNKLTRTNEVKVLEFGWEIQKRLKALYQDEDWGDPTAYDIEISATGEKLEREYQVVPKPKHPLTPDEVNTTMNCPLNLVSICNPVDEAPPHSADQPEYDPYA